MLTTFFKNGRASALELQNGRITAIYTDSRTPIVGQPAAYFFREAFPVAFARPEAFLLALGGRAAAADVASAASRY